MVIVTVFTRGCHTKGLRGFGKVKLPDNAILRWQFGVCPFCCVSMFHSVAYLHNIYYSDVSIYYAVNTRQMNYICTIFSSLKIDQSYFST